MPFNFRNLKPRYVEQDQFNWTQNNSLPSDKELATIYLYKASNLTMNGLQVFNDTTQNLLQISLENPPREIKGKPLMANGGLTLKPTYDNMLANIAFSEQPEFMIFDPLIQELFTGQTTAPNAVEGVKGSNNEHVGGDLYFIRLETQNSTQKATWFIANNVQAQVNTDNTFSVAKMRLTPFNASLLPKNTKIKFKLSRDPNAPLKATKYIRITTKPYTRIGEERIVGTINNPRNNNEKAVAKSWKYEKEPDGAIMTLEKPTSVSGSQVIWTSPWMAQNQIMWNEMKKDKSVFIGVQSSIGRGVNSATNFPILTINDSAFNYPYLNGVGEAFEDLDKSLLSKTLQHANYNKEIVNSNGVSSFGKIIETKSAGFEIVPSQMKIINYNPFFAQKSAYDITTSYLGETRGQLYTGLRASIGLPKSLFARALKTQTNARVPDYKTRLQSLMQSKDIPYWVHVGKEDTEIGQISKIGALLNTSPSQYFYTAIAPEQLTQVQETPINKINPENEDDKKYLWMTKAISYETAENKDNIYRKNITTSKTEYAVESVSANTIKGIGYILGIAKGQIIDVDKLSTEQYVRAGFFGSKWIENGVYGSAESINATEKFYGDRDWVGEDLVFPAHYDYLTWAGFSSNFTSAQLRNWYNENNEVIRNLPTDLIQEIELDEITYVDRINIAYHTGGAFKIELFDENRNSIIDVEDELPQDPSISQFTISLK